jgi:hypothetical protein
MEVELGENGSVIFSGPLSQRGQIARHDAGRACSGGRTEGLLHLLTSKRRLPSYKFGGKQSTACCAWTVCCLAVLLATAIVRTIATATKTAETMNGNNFTNVSPKGKYRPQF